MKRGTAKKAGERSLAFVVFTGEADLKWLRILKPGFRHCFAVLESQGRWIIYNPLSHHTEIMVLDGLTALALVEFYRAKGCPIVPWRLTEVEKKPAPFGVYTCVEALKRVLGIHARGVITPWNLFKFLKLKNIGKKPLTSGKILIN